jgi:hypothetical protein
MWPVSRGNLGTVEICNNMLDAMQSRGFKKCIYPFLGS